MQKNVEIDIMNIDEDEMVQEQKKDEDEQKTKKNQEEKNKQDKESNKNKGSEKKNNKNNNRNGSNNNKNNNIGNNSNNGTGDNGNNRDGRITCKFFLTSSCRFGHKCRNIHPEICKEWAAKGKCRNINENPQCKLAHPKKVQKICM